MKSDLLKEYNIKLTTLQRLKKTYENDIDLINQKLKKRSLIIKIIMFVFFPLRLFDFCRIKKLFTQRKLTKINKPILKLQKKQLVEIKKYLYNNNLRYKELVNLNYDLLSSRNLKIKTYKKGGSIGSSYSKKIEGKIFSNGFMYLKIVKTNILIFSYQSGLYPKVLKGKVDCFGNVQLKTVKTNWAFFGGRIPKMFVGAIGNNGDFVARIYEKEWEPIGTLNMNKLICNPFNSDEKKRRLFLNNRLELLSIIEKTKKQEI